MSFMKNEFIQLGSQKLLFSLRVTKVTEDIILKCLIHWLTAYLLEFTMFCTSMKWLYYQNYVNQITSNHRWLEITFNSEDASHICVLDCFISISINQNFQNCIKPLCRCILEPESIFSFTATITQSVTLTSRMIWLMNWLTKILWASLMSHMFDYSFIVTQNTGLLIIAFYFMLQLDLHVAYCCYL